MTKRQARNFAIGSTVLATLALLGLTIDSHRQFPKLTNAENITPAVEHGMDVWHKYNCINCHTLFGEGAYYAPDLTKITKLRGEPYLIAYMKDPSQFYDEERHRRLMPKQDLSDQEIKDLFQFLEWVSNVDNQGWPPRPILVSGAVVPGTDFSQERLSGAMEEEAPPPPGTTPVTGAGDPRAQGENVFRTVAPACNACHSVTPGVNLAGPSLAGIVGRTEELLASGSYTGKATDVEGYIRESITDPSAFLVEGAAYSANGVSFMPATYGKDLTPEQLDQLVAYLGSVK